MRLRFASTKFIIAKKEVQQQVKAMILRLKRLILVIVLLAGLAKVHTQKEFATITLDDNLKEVKEILKFSDDQGHLLLNFHNRYTYQYNLIRPDKTIETQSIKLDKRYRFIESIYDEKEFTLFYRNTRTKDIYLYRADKQFLPDSILKSNTSGPKEKALLGTFSQGDFWIFNHSRKPFTLHTYRYLEGKKFEKRSQAFLNSKRETSFAGRILTEDEIILVRYTLSPPILHFYRFFKDSGFERRSIELRPIYEKVGFRNKIRMVDIFYLSSNNELSAYIQGDDIYLDMENLISANDFRARNKRYYPSVLRLNWESGDAQVLRFDTLGQWKFRNRAVVLKDNLYFKLLMDKERLDLAVYDIVKAKRIKRYSYHRDQEIDLFHGQASLNSRTSFYLGFFSSSVLVPVALGNGKNKKISNKKLFKHLSSAPLFLDVSSDDEVIELSASGTRQREVFVLKTETASFTSYLSKPNLNIIDNIDDFNDPRWKLIDQFLERLSKEKKKLGVYTIYQYRDQIHLAYIDKKLKCCKIIAF